MQRKTFGQWLAVLSMSVLIPASSSFADTFPSRAVSIIVPFSVGGSTDLVARLVASGMGEQGTETIVDNRTGGGGVIGWNTVARAKPDGYTLLTTEMSYAIAASLVPNLPFDPKKSLQQITIAASVPHVLVVNPAVKAKTVQEFIDLAKANPGKFFYGSGGTGTNTHLGGALFNSLAGVELVHVPYRGAGAALKDLIAGETQALITSIPTALPYIRSGQLRALLVTSEDKVSVLPDVPSAPEVGMPKMVMKFWIGFAAPEGTPAPIMDRLNKDLVATVNSPEIKKRLIEQGLDPVGSTAQQATQLLDDEIERWREVIQAAGIKPN
ncbi:MAG TPA: tripartite tricarboxylate transporter substrate binding protein [Eoetvoesiella sp.]